jgi:hypothetical protein
VCIESEEGGTKIIHQISKLFFLFFSPLLRELQKARKRDTGRKKTDSFSFCLQVLQRHLSWGRGRKKVLIV